MLVMKDAPLCCAALPSNLLVQLTALTTVPTADKPFASGLGWLWAMYAACRTENLTGQAPALVFLSGQHPLSLATLFNDRGASWPRLEHARKTHLTMWWCLLICRPLPVWQQPHISAGLQSNRLLTYRIACE